MTALSPTLPPLGCFVRFRSVAPAIAPVISPVALYLLLVPGLVHFSSLRRLAHCQSPAKPVLCPSPVVQLSPRFVQPSVLPIPLFPQLLESVPSPVAEFLRPFETIPSPFAPNSALVRVVPTSRPVLPHPPPPWFPNGSSIRSPLVLVLASAL